MGFGPQSISRRDGADLDLIDCNSLQFVPIKKFLLRVSYGPPDVVVVTASEGGYGAAG